MFEDRIDPPLAFLVYGYEKLQFKIWVTAIRLSIFSLANRFGREKLTQYYSCIVIKWPCFRKRIVKNHLTGEFGGLFQYLLDMSVMVFTGDSL
jgi:hypothetical protein